MFEFKQWNVELKHSAAGEGQKAGGLLLLMQSCAWFVQDTYGLNVIINSSPF